MDHPGEIAMADIQKIVDDAWAAPHAPQVVPHGAQVRLVHPFGPFVAFDLKRSDLALAPQEFADRILAKPIADLRKLAST